MKPGYNPIEFGPRAGASPHMRGPAEHWMCLVSAHRFEPGLKGYEQHLFGRVSGEYETRVLSALDGFSVGEYPEGSLLHFMSARHFAPRRGDVLQATLPKHAHVIEKLGKGNWRAQDDVSGATFEFSEASDRFVRNALDSRDDGMKWPSVGAALTYHTSSSASGPLAPFAIMVRQQLAPEKVRETAAPARPNMFGLAAVVVLASAAYGVAKAFGLITHRDHPRADFYLPEGYGRKPQPAPKA